MSAPSNYECRILTYKYILGVVNIDNEVKSEVSLSLTKNPYLSEFQQTLFCCQNFDAKIIGEKQALVIYILCVSGWMSVWMHLRCACCGLFFLAAKRFICRCRIGSDSKGRQIEKDKQTRCHD